MNYPDDIRQYDCDHLSPFFAGYVCSQCKRSDIDCACELEAAREAVLRADDALTDFANESGLGEAYEEHETCVQWIETLSEKMETSKCPALADVIKWEVKTLERINSTIDHLEPVLGKLQAAFSSAQKLVKELGA